jgi:hypothetical protein
LKQPTPGWIPSSLTSIVASQDQQNTQRSAPTRAESNEELDDIFAWQELRKLSKTLTFRYDKMIYLVEPTEENTRIAGEK